MADSASVAVKATTPGAWRLGPEHPYYEYSADDGDYDNGSMMARRFHLTPEGVWSVSRADSAGSEPAASSAQPDRAPSGHQHCPAVLGCREGRIPEGWVRSGEVRP